MIGKIINKVNSKLGDTLILEEDFLGSIDIQFHLMEIPSVDLKLPVRYARFLTGNSEIHLETEDWNYIGIVDKKVIDIEDATVTVATSHVMTKLEDRRLPTNVTFKDKLVKDIIKEVWDYWKDSKEDLVNKFTVKFTDTLAEKYALEYEFSNETLVEFLTKVCEKTTDLYWRLNLKDPYVIEVGVFGYQKNVLINEQNYLISIDNVEEDYSEIVNMAVVMSDKSDGGASSLTLRDIFYNKQYMLKGFPVFKTDHKVNSQRHFDYPQLLVFAPEQRDEEYAIMDEEGIALEGGELYWGTLTNNDTQAIAEDNKELSDEDRLDATIQMYQGAIRKMKNSRRKIIYSITISPLPSHTVNVGDKVMFQVNDEVRELVACSSYMTKVLKANDWFFVTDITDTVGVGNTHTQELKLSKYIYSDRDLLPR